MRAVLIASLALLFAYACVPAGGGGGGSNRPVPQNPRPRPIADDHPAQGGKAADGAKCSTAGDCQSGICEGEGCGDGGGTCAPASRGCTRDLREYCGCDGQTFRSSGSCPGKRFSARGPCTGAP